MLKPLLLSQLSVVSLSEQHEVNCIRMVRWWDIKLLDWSQINQFIRVRAIIDLKVIVEHWYPSIVARW